MATIDWPTTDAFKPTLPYSFGVSTPKSGARGFYTGENETVGHLSDRLLVTMNLPPCSGQQAKERSAFLIGAMSNGDRFRFSPWNAKSPHGTIAGSPTVGANAAAGARSVTISGARSGVNLIRGGSFEVDANTDTLGDGWAAYSAGSVTGAAFSLQPTLANGFGSLNQAISATSLGTSSSDRVGVSQTSAPIVAGTTYTLSAYAAWTAASTAALALYIDWRTSGGAFISASTNFGSNMSGSLSRVLLTAAAPATAAFADVYIFAHSRVSAAGVAAFAIDGAQLEAGSAATAFSGSPTLAGGDLIATGGNLLMTAYAGAAINDAGAGSVPLALPLLRPLTTGQAITLINPVGTWQIDTTDGIAFDFAANVLQMGVTIPFRQVAV